MTIEQILPLALFAFATSITPGPNNTMVIASGANFGFRATVPHLIGIDLGFAFMIIAVGAGLGGLFVVFPLLHTALKYAGAAYLLHLAWRIAGAGAPKPGDTVGQPMTFLQAALFQWLNPKGWMSAIGAVTTYTPPEPFAVNLIVVTAVFALVMAPCIAVWAAAGMALRSALDKPLHLRVFNVAMSILLVASLFPVFFNG